MFSIFMVHLAESAPAAVDHGSTIGAMQLEKILIFAWLTVVQTLHELEHTS